VSGSWSLAELSSGVSGKRLKFYMREILSTLRNFFGVSRKNKSLEPNTQRAAAASLEPGPIGHKELSPIQMERIRKLRDALAEVERSPIEKWVDNFKQDTDPDRELAIWERIAAGYARHCSKRRLSPDAKEDVFRLLLFRSMATEHEVLNRAKLKTLTVDEAKEALKEF
jgi:hypothetical protein